MHSEPSGGRDGKEERTADRNHKDYPRRPRTSRRGMEIRLSRFRNGNDGVLFAAMDFGERK